MLVGKVAVDTRMRWGGCLTRIYSYTLWPPLTSSSSVHKLYDDIGGGGELKCLLGGGIQRLLQRYPSSPLLCTPVSTSFFLFKNKPCPSFSMPTATNFCTSTSFLAAFVAKKLTITPSRFYSTTYSTLPCRCWA
uniref:Uncharacterized protein n=1 Tax=Salix viminalis TaxID=40686 RepID=A0A6N2MNP1_SALVM